MQNRKIERTKEKKKTYVCLGTQPCLTQSQETAPTELGADYHYETKELCLFPEVKIY